MAVGEGAIPEAGGVLLGTGTMGAGRWQRAFGTLSTGLPVGHPGGCVLLRKFQLEFWREVEAADTS